MLFPLFYHTCRCVRAMIVDILRKKIEGVDGFDRDLKRTPSLLCVVLGLAFPCESSSSSPTPFLLEEG